MAPSASWLPLLRGWKALISAGRTTILDCFPEANGWALNNRDEMLYSRSDFTQYGYSSHTQLVGTPVEIEFPTVNHCLAFHRAYVYARAINDHSTLLGFDDRCSQVAFLRDSAGTMTDLSLTAGSLSPTALNNPCDVLFGSPAHIWRNGRIYAIAIRISGWKLNSVNTMNDDGLIVGSARAPGSTLDQAVVLTRAVP